ncbi:MAG: hypothetical protein EBZ69_00270 [Alphaproteobacteria bacterium]|nr:hypothetical protein [Alphaproteobacteria bacterium]
MSEALAKIYALQQREINENERARQALIAQNAREIRAFMDSGLPAIFTECAGVPLRHDVQQRHYKKTLGECAWSHQDPRRQQIKEIALPSIGGGTGSGPRWWCKEDADSGRMVYCYNATGSYSGGTVWEKEPNERWIGPFIEYIAKMCDPQAIADKLSESQANQAVTDRFTRRQIQRV